jgi:hypothetical protein
MKPTVRTTLVSLIALLGAALLTLSMAHRNGLIDFGRPRSPAMLSVQQTVRAAYFGIGCGNDEKTPYPVWSRANPEAKAALYAILQDKSQEQYFHNAVRMIGYMGDAEDVGRLDEILARYAGVGLAGYEKITVSTIFQALGVMQRRGVAVAQQKLEQMLRREYWTGRKLRWHPDTIAGTTGVPTNDDETLCHVFTGYACSDRVDLAAKQTRRPVSN